MRYLLVNACQLFAQNKILQEITTADGLSQSYIYQIYQTKDSYIWISTNDGLNRYDGYNFKVFTFDKHKNLEITDNRIRGIHEDSQNRLWVSSQSRGLYLLDRVKNRFYKCQITDKPRPRAENITGYKILQDKYGHLWLGGGMSTVFGSGFYSTVFHSLYLIIKSRITSSLKKSNLEKANVLRVSLLVH